MPSRVNSPSHLDSKRFLESSFCGKICSTISRCFACCHQDNLHSRDAMYMRESRSRGAMDHRPGASFQVYSVLERVASRRMPLAMQVLASLGSPFFTKKSPTMQVITLLLQTRVFRNNLAFLPSFQDLGACHSSRPSSLAAETSNKTRATLSTLKLGSQKSFEG